MNSMLLKIFLRLSWMTAILTCCISNTLAQSAETASLLEKVYQAKSDTEKLDAILKVCMRNDIDTETFNKLAFLSESLAAKSGDLQKIGMSAYMVSWSHYLSSNNDSARFTIDEALQKLNVNDPRYADVVFKLRSFKATTYQSEQNNTEALRILFPLLEDVRKSGNHVFIAQTLHLIAIVEGQQKNALKTIEWEMQALPLLNSAIPNENNIRGTVLATLGKAYMQLNQSDSAIYYNQKAIENFRSTEDLYNLAITMQRQAQLLTSKNELASAEVILNELSDLNARIHMGDGDKNFWMAFIDYYIQAKNYDKAISLIQERLEKAGESSERNATKWGIRLAYYEALSKCYKAQGHTLQYADMMEKILIAKDSLYEINSADAIADLQTKYEVQKKENTIIEQKLQLNRKNIIMYGAMGIFLVISLLTWNHFRNAARRQELKMQLQMQEDKRIAEQAVQDAEENERKRIAADLHDNLGSYAASIVSNIRHLENASAHHATLLELKENSQAMVSMLSDTIWALKKEKMMFTAISDRVKLLLQRLTRSYPEIQLEVKEEIEIDIVLQPSHAYQLFSIIHEAVNNALKHGEAQLIQVKFLSHSNDNPRVLIADNGCGKLADLETIGSGNGLYNMRKRAELLGWNIEWKENGSEGIVVEISQSNSN